MPPPSSLQNMASSEQEGIRLALNTQGRGLTGTCHHRDLSPEAAQRQKGFISGDNRPWTHTQAVAKTDRDSL